MFAQSVWTLITYALSDITFKKTYCVPLFKDTIKPLQLFVKRRHFFSQHNQ